MGVPGPWYQRLPHFRMGFYAQRLGKELQSEYFSCPASMRSKRFWRLNDCATRSVRIYLISEIRAIAGRQFVDESMLRAGLRNHSLYVETGLASCRASCCP